MDEGNLGGGGLWPLDYWLLSHVVLLIRRAIQPPPHTANLKCVKSVGHLRAARMHDAPHTLSVLLKSRKLFRKSPPSPTSHTCFYDKIKGKVQTMV